MELANVVAGAVALLFIYYLLSSKFTNPKGSKKRAPPEAGGAFPFVGHLHLMIGSTHEKLPHFALAAVADKYGPIFTIRIGVHRALVVSSPVLARELFTSCDAIISSRPRLLAAKHLGYDSAMFAFAPYGPYWRDIRKLITVELLSSRRIELLRNVRVSEMRQCIQELYKVWEEKKDSSGRVLVEMKNLLWDLNLNVLLRMVAGKRYFGAKADGEEALRCQKVLNDFFHFSGVFTPADALPYLRWLDFGGFEKKMIASGKELDSIVAEWLEEHRRKKYSGKDKPEDFMDVMLATVKDADLQGQFDSDTIIKATCMGLVAGGSDGPTVVIVWVLSMLLNNRHVLKKAQEELDMKIGRERLVEESDIGGLVYMQAVIKETLRLYPPGSLGGHREFTEDGSVGGYFIPKGTRLIVNLWKLHRDPSVWDSPLEFKPERFLDAHKHVEFKGLDFELMPFGAGRRSCPATNFGLQMLYLILANLLQAFDFSTVNDDLVDMTESPGLINGKATPLDVLIAPRLPPSLY